MGELFAQSISDQDFARVAELVERTVGIHLPAHKRSMVELRVARRARVLGMTGLDEYCAFIFDEGGASVEQTSLIDALTTNKTDFFRESEHFDILTGDVLPELRTRYPDLGGVRPLRVWSAGCATGEEPYTIAMVLEAYAERHAPFAFDVRATDVSSAAIRQAVRAVYPEERVCAVPVELRRRCLLRHKDHTKDLVRIAPEIRSTVRFTRHNLFADPPLDAGLFDVVFCRNVIIYFRRENQIEVLRRIADSLVPGGYLFVGHSETLHGMPLPLERVGPTLYRKVAE